MRAWPWIAAIAGGLLILTGFAAAIETCPPGFPDGHLTEYAAATRMPVRVLGATNILLGVYLVVVARKRSTRRTVVVSAALVVLSLVVVPLLMRYYFIAIRGLEDGWGG